ncbi:MAG TPA: IPT/TIG domain-containing protein [Thermoanaerobaculia bacterium]|nr:IPT/TIG domain-containing protein [Thermoanaerobaculia bacterium]
MTLTRIEPPNGDPEGGEFVRIFGSGFVPGRTTVTFGGLAAAVTYVSSTELLVTTPSGPIGDADVAVTTPAGSAQLAGGFNYVPPFTALTITPTNPVFDPGQNVQFNVSGVTAAGATTDLTTLATWSSNNHAVVTINAVGLAQALAIGSATITATYGSLSATTLMTVRDPSPLDPIPPDPVTIAPPFDPVALLSFDDSTAFLYTGANAIQQGVVPGTIEPLRSSVIRGRVLDRDGQPLPAVRVTIADRPEFGRTVSRLDGRFDLVVNGGADLIVRYERNGYLTTERQVRAPWQDFVQSDDVVLIGFDPNVTAVIGEAGIMQVARGSVMTDSDGTRRATLMFFPGTKAIMVMPDGSTETLPTLSVRATEYTVGANGPKAMPAPLPPTSAYTYCVELTVDEALARGAATVQFTQPVRFYVENFLGFPVGTGVPAAAYDRAKNAWMPSLDGRVIRIISIESGAARVDTNGDGAVDEFLLSSSERQELGALYAPGTSLWRVLINHFTPYDMNFPVTVVAPDATPPTGGAYSFPAKENSCTASGSIIECENQTLGEDIGVNGTPFALHYRSDRTNGRVASRTLDVQLSGSHIPSTLSRIEVEVSIAGRFVRQTFPANADQTYRFVWDGHDAYGRAVNGSRPVTVRTSYVYDGEYEFPAPGTTFPVMTFGRASGLSTGVRARVDVPMTQTWTGTLGSWNVPSSVLGGWTLSPHHFYDFAGKTLYRGDGSRRTDTPQVFGAPNGAVTKVPGSPETLVCIGCGLQGMTVGPDGSIYLAQYTYIRKITPGGQLVHVAGNGQDPISRAMPPPSVAATSPVNATGLSFGPDGSLYVAEAFRSRVRRIDSDGIISGVAGGGSTFIEGGPARSVNIDFPKDVAAAPDGSFYVCDSIRHRVYRVRPDGIIKPSQETDNEDMGATAGLRRQRN